MRRGEIYWANLVPRSGSEQTGHRPVLVISNDGFNQVPAWRSVIVIPFSTFKIQSKRGPTAVFISKGTGGLPQDSLALCHQVTTLDRSKLIDLIGILHENALEQVESGLKKSLGL